MKQRIILRKVLRLIHDILYLVLIRRYFKSYIKNQIKKRKGVCLNCGWCCSYRQCIYLNNKTYNCKIYNKRKRDCLNPFPIDELEQFLIGVDICCGYYWKEEKYKYNWEWK